jgi:hypothetical protein
MINAILCVLVAYVLVSPYFYAKAVKFGMSLVERPKKIASEPIFSVPKPKKKPKMTPEEDRTAQILRNIDNYNGSSQGQVKVEVKHD